jgi:hypothetical protein
MGQGYGPGDSAERLRHRQLAFQPTADVIEVGLPRCAEQRVQKAADHAARGGSAGFVQVAQQGGLGGQHRGGLRRAERAEIDGEVARWPLVQQPAHLQRRRQQGGGGDARGLGRRDHRFGDIGARPGEDDGTAAQQEQHREEPHAQPPRPDARDQILHRHAARRPCHGRSIVVVTRLTGALAVTSSTGAGAMAP